jgi:hypothetical protein
MSDAWFEGYLAAMHGQPSDANPHADTPFWQAFAGTVWSWSRDEARWHGWEPGTDQAWSANLEEFRDRYPDGPPWDA